jgi:hypothetical protein
VIESIGARLPAPARGRSISTEYDREAAEVVRKTLPPAPSVAETERPSGRRFPEEEPPTQDWTLTEALPDEVPAQEELVTEVTV